MRLAFLDRFVKRFYHKCSEPGHTVPRLRPQGSDPRYNGIPVPKQDAYDAGPSRIAAGARVVAGLAVWITDIMTLSTLIVSTVSKPLRGRLNFPVTMMIIHTLAPAWSLLDA
jgi:hypothetical protein